MKSLNRSEFHTQRAAEGLQVRTLSSGEPIISLEEAKNYLRVDFDADDALITSFVAAVTEAAEQYSGRAFVEKTILVYWSRFQSYGVLPYPPHRQIVKVERKVNDEWVEMEEPDYTLVGDEQLTIRMAVILSSEGAVDCPVRVTLECGYLLPEEVSEGNVDNPAEIPAIVVPAILDTVGFLYTNKGELQVDGGGRIDSLLTPVTKAMLNMIKVF